LGCPCRVNPCIVHLNQSQGFASFLEFGCIFWASGLRTIDWVCPSTAISPDSKDDSQTISRLRVFFPLMVKQLLYFQITMDKS
jgi:hypothetical protein